MSALPLMPVRQITQPEILAACLMLWGVPYHRLRSARRSMDLVNIRHAVMVALHEEADMTSVAIGKLLERDHSTVLYALKRRKVTPVAEMVRELVALARSGTGIAAPPP